MTTADDTLKLPEIALSGVSSSISVGGKNYMLFGAIQFVSSETRAAHYIAHYRRSNRWIKLDDMENQIDNSDESLPIQIHMLMFTSV